MIGVVIGLMILFGGLAIILQSLVE